MTLWMNCLVTFAAIFGTNLACNFAEPQQNGSSRISIEDYLSKHYDKTSKPQCGNRTVILVDIYILSFGKVEEANMEFSVFMYFRQLWNDPRLAGLVNKTIVLSRNQISLLWLPDTFCSNAKTSDLMIPDNEVHSAINLFPNGDIYYSRGAHVTASCNMDLRDFPMDTQTCKMKFESYGYTEDDIELVWRNKSIEIANKEMAQFYVEDVILSKTSIRYTLGHFTILETKFVLNRRVGYYVIQMYIPCVFLVMLSWIVFWMGTEETGNRLTVGITTILTIVFLLGYTNSSLPKVSYVKGLDMYLIVSFLFIFLSLVECIIVDKCYKLNKIQSKKALLKKRKRKQSLFNKSIDHEILGMNGKRLRSQSTQTINGNTLEMNSSLHNRNGHSSKGNENTQDFESWVDIDDDEVKNISPNSKKFCTQKSWNEVSLAVKVDRISRVLFPFLFSVYNIVYWFTYLNQVQIFHS